MFFKVFFEDFILWVDLKKKDFILTIASHIGKEYDCQEKSLEKGILQTWLTQRRQELNEA